MELLYASARASTRGLEAVRLIQFDRNRNFAGWAQAEKYIAERYREEYRIARIVMSNMDIERGNGTVG